MAATVMRRRFAAGEYHAMARAGILAEDIRVGEEGGLTATAVRRYLTPVRTKVSTKGQIVLPAEIRRQDDIRPGQEFEIERIDRGEYRLVLHRGPTSEGLVEWLRACPEKGFFVPIESESTDAL